MQQYAGVYLLQNYSTCFGCLSHPSSGVHKTVTADSGTGHFLSCKANARVKLAKTGYGPHSSKLVVIVLFCRYLYCSVVIVLYCCYLCCFVIIYVVLCIFCV